MPRGKAITDLRHELFDATSRILSRSGPAALTSRAITDEAGCSKGVLHNHFDRLDDFLSDYVAEAFASAHREAEALGARAGAGSVRDNLVDFLMRLDTLPIRHAHALTAAIPGLLGRVHGHEPTAEQRAGVLDRAVSAYLLQEQHLGRVDAALDAVAAAAAVVSTAHRAVHATGPGDTGLELAVRVVEVLFGGPPTAAVGAGLPTMDS